MLLAIVMEKSAAGKKCDCEGAAEVEAQGQNGRRHRMRYCPDCSHLTHADPEKLRRHKAGEDLFGGPGRMPEGEIEKAAIPEDAWHDPEKYNLRWITAHPNNEEPGTPILVHDNGDSYTVVGGAHGRLNQMVLHKTGGKGKTQEARHAAREKRRTEAQERLKAQGVDTSKIHELHTQLKDAAREQTKALHDEILSRLSGGSATAEKLMNQARAEAEARAKSDAPDAAHEDIKAAGDTAAKRVQQEVKAAAHQVVNHALEGHAMAQAGDAVRNEDQEALSAIIGGRKLTKHFTPEELSSFLDKHADIASIRAQSRAVAAAIEKGDPEVVRGIEQQLTPLTTEQAKEMELAKYLDRQNANVQTALVQESEQASEQAQARHQANGASDSINSLVASVTGDAIISPDLVKAIGIENAGRVAAAYLQQHGVDGKALSTTIRDRVEAQGFGVAKAALDKCQEMEDLAKASADAARSGDGTVSKGEASILAMNMAAERYRVLNVARGQLRSAQALAEHLSRKSTAGLDMGGYPNAVAAYAAAKKMGLERGDYGVRRAERGGKYTLAIKAESLHKMAHPQSIKSAEANTALDELKEKVGRDGWSSPALNPNIMLKPHQELAARAIEQQKHMLLALGAGSGKTPTAYCAFGDLMDQDKIDRALFTMPSKPKAQQMDYTDEETGEQRTGEANKFLRPDLAKRVVVVKDGAHLKRVLGRLAEGEKLGIVMSPQLMREHAYELEKAGFGGKRSMVVFDEAHELAIGSKEGAGNQAAQAARKLAGAEYAVAMTGTPIENSAGELHSLFDLVHPGELGSQKAFEAEWQRLARVGGGVFSPEAMAGMKSRLSGGMLSYFAPVTRKGENGADEPVSLTHNVVTVPASESQKAKIAGIQARYQKDRSSENPATRAAAGLVRRGAIMRALSSGDDSNKIAKLREIMAAEKAADPKARVGVYASEFGPLRQAGKALGGKLERLTGENSEAETREAVGRINNRENDTDGIMLSNAANYGVNLQGMDHLIKMHPIDVPSKEDQLDHRHYRTGQTRDKRENTLMTDHPAEQLTQYRNRRVKLPEVALLASLSDDTQVSSVLAGDMATLQRVASSGPSGGESA